MGLEEGGLDRLGGVFLHERKNIVAIQLVAAERLGAIDVAQEGKGLREPR